MDWGEPERLAVNLANIYAELSGEEPPDGLAGFQDMAAMAFAKTEQPQGGPA